MAECADRNCRDGIYQKIEDYHVEMKRCLSHKADKMSKPVILSIITIIVTICIFIGGVPLMYSISAAKDKQSQINDNHESIRTYSVKQDVILENQKDFKRQIEKMQDKRELDKKELNKKLEKIINAIQDR